MVRFIILFGFFILLFCPVCHGTQANLLEGGQGDLVDSIPVEAWGKIRHAKIFFAHKSVGDGIVMGMKELMNESSDLELNIVESDSLTLVTDGIFIHSHIGKNSNPESKMEAFETRLNGGLGEKLDYAILKFCWADILPNTNIEAVFKRYKSTVDKVKQAYPNLTILHFTVPLTSNHGGVQAYIKRVKDFVKIVLGKLNYYDNSMRNRFNEMMRKEYLGKEPLFDLARIENGKGAGNLDPDDYSLFPGYTDDGGHLNERGRKIVSKQFLVFLSKTVTRSSSF